MEKQIPDINEIAPAFTVQAETGETFELGKVLAEGNNLLLVFYRGHW